MMDQIRLHRKAVAILIQFTIFTIYIQNVYIYIQMLNLFTGLSDSVENPSSNREVMSFDPQPGRTGLSKIGTISSNHTVITLNTPYHTCPKI